MAAMAARLEGGGTRSLLLIQPMPAMNLTESSGSVFFRLQPTKYASICIPTWRDAGQQEGHT